MPRYIDAEILIHNINENRELSRWAKDVAILCVMDTPVENVARIVRCKDCKHSNSDSRYLLCGIYREATGAERFCSSGECRKG